MKRKYIFLDIDGTLAMPGNETSAENLEAIRKARERGHKVFLGTGRTKKDVPDHIRAIGFDGGCYASGGLVEVEGEKIAEEHLTSSELQEILSVLDEIGANYFLEGESENYLSEGEQLIFEEPAETSSEIMRSQEMQDPIDDELRSPLKISDYQGEPVYKVNFRIPREMSESVAEINRRLGEKYSICYFDVLKNLDIDLPIIVGEVTNKSINKGDAIREIVEYYGADIEDSIAFGDSTNDATMLEASGTGVAMDNATDEFKELADVVCESCNDSGVAKEFKRQGLFEKVDLDYNRILSALEEKVRSLWSDNAYSSQAQTKKVVDVVTETDLEFERILIKKLHELAPEVAILSEETLSDTLAVGTYFTIDPVDGTWNYSHGVPIYGTQIALVVDDEPVLGLIYLPKFDYMYTGIIGQGAYRNGERLSIKPEVIDRALVAVMDLRKRGGDLKMQLNFSELITERFGRPRMNGCTSFDLAMVAEGSYQGKVTYKYNLWDVVPGILLIREAGGLGILTEKYCIGAASKEIADALLECLEEALETQKH